MFIEGQKVRYIKTNEQVTIEDVNNDSNGEWHSSLCEKVIDYDYLKL